MTLRDRLLRRRSAGSVEARVALADAACRSGRLREAAALYAQVATSSPGLAGFWVSAGNCLKDAQDYSSAFAAYRNAHAALGPSGDLAMQLGHLFKESGNFAAALQAYRMGERLGDPHAAPEIAGFPGLDVGAARLGPPGGEAPPLGVFHAVWACGLPPAPDPVKLRAASRALENCGQTETARAFAEAAFLLDPGPAAWEDHLRHAATSALWSGPALKRLVEAGARKAAPTLDNWHDLVFLAANPQAPIPATPPKAPRWPPAELAAADAAALLAQASALTARAHDVLAHGGRSDGADAVAAAQAIHEATSPAGALVALAPARTPEALTQICARVLHDALGAWAARVRPRYLQGATWPALVGAFVALRANPLALRIAQGASPEALAFEIDGLLRGALRERYAAEADAARAALLRLCLPEIPADAARALLALYRRPDAPRTCAALIAARHVGNVGGEGETVAHAQDLKRIGLHQEALAVLDSGLDTATSSRAAIVEWGLTAKINGEFSKAARLLERAYAQEPSDFLRRELAVVLPEVETVEAVVARFAGDPEFLAVARERSVYRLALDAARSAPEPHLAGGDRIADLAPEIAGELAGPPASGFEERIDVLQLGQGRRWNLGHWRRRLRPISAVRVRVASQKRVAKLRVRLDGRTVGEANASPLREGHELSSLAHAVFNAWFDLGGFEPGLHELQLYFEEWDGGYRTWEEVVWLDTEPASPPAAAASAAIVELDGSDRAASVEARVAALPSLRLPARRQTFAGPFEKILVVRADQLGDAVMSVPAMLALRRHFPKASLHGLFAPAQHDLMRSLALFDALHVVDFPYDQTARRRSLGLAQQAELKARLAPHRFDLAIDLSPGPHSRPLLRLAGARYTAGFTPRDFPWMSFGVEIQSRDPGNGHACVSHSHAPESLVESLALALKRPDVTLPRAALSPDFALRLGLPEGRRYAVLHTGARTESRKWPVGRFVEVARRLVEETRTFVVFLLDGEADLAEPPERLEPRDFALLTGPINFADFDGLLSQASVFVGNDTGPKHLAALRGTPVVSIHMGAINWSEWGQDGSGVIVTRRAPCYGCGIELNEECGKGLPCLHDISPGEVFDAARKYLG